MNLFFALSIASVVLFLVVVPVLRRKQAEKNADAQWKLGEQASALGLRTQGANVRTGEMQFAGESEGVTWSANIEAPVHQSNSRNKSQSTRLTYPGLTSAPGTFILAVAFPPGVKVPEMPSMNDGGFLASIAERAGEALLDVYVEGYFGAEHRALVNVAGAARSPAPEGFWLLSTDPALAARLLDTEGQALLSALRLAEVKEGTALAKAGFGVLISPSGFKVGCQVALTDPARLKFIADKAARLVAHAAGRA